MSSAHSHYALGSADAEHERLIRQAAWLAPYIEALHRFVEREPLRRVHECVFGVLALESEPVDPRL